MKKKAQFLSTKYKAMFTAGLLGWVVFMVDAMADSVLAGIFITVFNKI